MRVLPDHPVPDADQHEQDEGDDSTDDVDARPAAAIEWPRHDRRNDSDEEGVDEVLNDTASSDPGLRLIDRATLSWPSAPGLTWLLTSLLALESTRLTRHSAGRLAVVLLPGHGALRRAWIAPFAGPGALLRAAPLTRLVPLRHAAHLIPRSTPAMTAFCGS